MKEDKYFKTIVFGFFGSLALFAVSVLDGNPRDILSLLMAVLAIIFAVALVIKFLDKKQTAIEEEV